MPRPEFAAVVFDVGGVLADQDVETADALYGRVGPGLTADRVNAVRRTTALYGLWEAYSIGRTDGPTYWRAVAEALGVAVGRWPLLQRAHAATVWARRLPEGWAVADGLRSAGTVGLGVLSNSAPECEGHVAVLDGLFDVLHLSHRTGRRKPEADAYLGVARALGADPQRIVFVDDQARNVDAAAGLGMTAIRYEAGELAGRLARLGLRGAGRA